MGLAKPDKSHGLRGTRLGFARQEVAGRVFGWVWNWTDLFLQSEPTPLTDYPDLLLTLTINLAIPNFWCSTLYMMALGHSEVPCHSWQRNNWLQYRGTDVYQDLNDYAGFNANAEIVGLPYTDS